MSHLANSRLKFYYQNINLLDDKSKRDDLKTLSQTGDFSIFILVETKLNSEIKENELFDNSYKVSRKDLIKKSLGGVLIAVKNDFTFTEQPVRSLKLGQEHRVQCTWIKIDLNGLGILNVCAIYIHPTCTADNFESFFEQFVQIYEKARDELYLIAGDFNFKNYQKSEPTGRNQSKQEVFKKAIERCELTLVNPQDNSNGVAMLDKVYCSKSISNQIIPAGSSTGSLSRLKKRVKQNPALCFEFECSQRRHTQLPTFPSSNEASSEAVKLLQLNSEVIQEISSDDESNSKFVNVQNAVQYIAKFHDATLRKLVDEIRPSAIDFNLMFNQIKHQFVTLSLTNQNKISETVSDVNLQGNSAIPGLYLSGNLKEFIDNVKWLERTLSILQEEFSVLTNKPK